MAQLSQFKQGHPKAAFSENVQRGDQGKFFENRPKSSPCLKGPKEPWRKWHYPLISIHLKCKDWRRFWRKQRLLKCPNGQVMEIFARSPKTGIFWKSAIGDQGKFLKNRPKSSPRLKGKQPLWRQWHYPLIKMHLTWKDWKRFRRKQRLKKCPNGQVMSIFGRSPKTHIFRKSAKKRPREVFQISPRKKPSLQWATALWRKCHYPLNCIYL